MGVQVPPRTRSLRALTSGNAGRGPFAWGCGHTLDTAKFLSSRSEPIRGPHPTVWPRRRPERTATGHGHGHGREDRREPQGLRPPTSPQGRHNRLRVWWLALTPDRWGLVG